MDELFTLPDYVPLAAVGSFMNGGFNDGFGAGMLVLPPNQTTLHTMLESMSSATKYIKLYFVDEARKWRALRASESFNPAKMLIVIHWCAKRAIFCSPTHLHATKREARKIGSIASNH